MLIIPMLAIADQNHQELAVTLRRRQLPIGTPSAHRFRTASQFAPATVLNSLLYLMGHTSFQWLLR
jgi:hypothetical protein